MEQILLNGINVDQLLEKIGKLFDNKLENIVLPKSQTEYLTRLEVAKLLKITLPTLHDWTKQGWLKSYKIGNRVFYKLHEIEETLKRVSTIKFKKVHL